MKAKWVNIVKEVHGMVDEHQYARSIPGNKEYGAICSKPDVSKRVRRARAAHPTARRFAELMAETKAILRDPARKAEWQARYDEAVNLAQKRNKPIQGRLYDYIKHELSKEMSERMNG